MSPASTPPWMPELCRLPRLAAMLGLAELVVVVLALAPDGSRHWTFGELLSGTLSFNKALGQVIGKLGEMWMNSSFQTLFAGSSGWMGSVLSGLGIGQNANGTNNWAGGWTSINERGGEIVNLPSGTQIIPHDVSNRLADSAGGSGGALDVRITAAFDESGNLYVKQVAQAASASAVSSYDAALPNRVQQISANPRRR